MIRSESEGCSTKIEPDTNLISASDIGLGSASSFSFCSLLSSVTIVSLVITVLRSEKISQALAATVLASGASNLANLQDGGIIKQICCTMFVSSINN